MEKGMLRFKTSLLVPGLLLQVIMMAVGVRGGEEDCLGPVGSSMFTQCFYVSGKAPILCYECSSLTEGGYCDDPFNETHPELMTIRCKEYCVKWTRTTLSGRIFIQRTCSSELQIKMRKTVVCVQESRPSDGQLCFCDKDNCNTATTMYQPCHVALVVFLALIHFLLDHRRSWLPCIRFWK